MTRRAIGRVFAGFLLLAAPVMAAESPAELISSFRLKHGEVRVVRDATLDRIALQQARAMAAKDNLSHEVLGSFTRRIAPARAGRAAENIAYGYESFEKTLGQWIDSSGHRKNLLLHKASRVGIASGANRSTARLVPGSITVPPIERCIMMSNSFAAFHSGIELSSPASSLKDTLAACAASRSWVTSSRVLRRSRTLRFSAKLDTFTPSVVS
jgi:Cysteine-rich secretory protein family